MLRRFALLLLCASLPLGALCQTSPSHPPVDPALLAVAKAWSLPADASGTAQIWPGARPEDLASAALLWKSGGPVPAEGWRLRQAEKSWEGAALKAGLSVDEVLAPYRQRVGEKERAALVSAGSEWQVLAELQTLERLTGRNLRGLAAELAEKDFALLLAAAVPPGGTVATAARESAPENRAQEAPPGDGSMNPLGPALDQPPQNTGTIGASAESQRKGR